MLASKLVGMVNSVITGQTKSGIVRHAEERCFLAMAGITLDLHFKKQDSTERKRGPEIIEQRVERNEKGYAMR